MAQQMRFLKKNLLDITNPDAQLTVEDSLALSDGAGTLNFMRNRSNNSAWLTTSSVDTANTRITADLVDVRQVNALMLIDHNLKAFKFEYWADDSSEWLDLPTDINVTDETKNTSYFTFDRIFTSRFRLTIFGTQVPNSDKRIAQFIVSENIGSGQFEGWPIIKPQLSLNRKVSPMLSGKVNVVEGVGSYQVELSVVSWNNDSDLSIVEALYFGREGFLVWPCGGDESQFSTVRRGYRLKDIFYMRVTDEFEPVFHKGLYQMGVDVRISLSEAL